MMKLIFTLPLFLFTFAGSAGASVLEANLLKDSSFQQIPVYSQGGMGTCYAYAASELIDYYRLTHGVGLRSPEDLTSISWVAGAHSELGFSRKMNRLVGIADPLHPLDGGFFDSAIRSVEDFGVCSRGQMTEVVRTAHSDVFLSGVMLDADQLAQVMQTAIQDYELLLGRAYLSLVTGQAFQGEIGRRTYLPQVISRVPFPNLIPYASNGGVLPLPVPVVTTSPVSKPNPPAPAPVPAVPTSNVPYTLGKVELPRALRDATSVAQTSEQKYQIFETAKRLALGALLQQYRKQFSVENETLIRFVTLAYHHTNGLYGVFSELFASCKKEASAFHFQELHRLDVVPDGEAAFHRAIQSALTRNRPQPVAVSYCSKLLSTGKPARLNLFGPNACGSHASVIVGVRNIDVGSKVQYLIQNSWGTGCDGYSKEWDCVEGQGAIWVDARVLFQSSFNLVWLD